MCSALGSQGRFKEGGTAIAVLGSGKGIPAGCEVAGEAAGGAGLSDSGKERKGAGVHCMLLEARLTSGPALSVGGARRRRVGARERGRWAAEARVAGREWGGGEAGRGAGC